MFALLAQSVGNKRKQIKGKSKIKNINQKRKVRSKDKRERIIEVITNKLM